MYIYHIAKKEIWEIARGTGTYRPESFREDGFIHCSELDQVLKVANAFYAGRKALVLLEIDSLRVNFPIRYERVEDNVERFPHLYGPLKIDAVEHVHGFNPDDGEFRLPEGLSGLRS